MLLNTLALNEKFSQDLTETMLTTVLAGAPIALRAPTALREDRGPLVTMPSLRFWSRLAPMGLVTSRRLLARKGRRSFSPSAPCPGLWHIKGGLFVCGIISPELVVEW
jgi:hypothetical protein